MDDSVMLFVPAGAFWMGSTDEDIDAILAECSDCQRNWYVDEQPQHEVTLDAFWIDRTEVTNAQYRRCVEDGACNPPLRKRSYTRDSYYGDPEFDNYPVVYTDWEQANAYCTWASKRLPTEAEWEKAARGTEGLLYPGGHAFDGNLVNLCDANCTLDWKNEDWDDGYPDTAPVGSYEDGASLYGALDMAGNVWEWVADWYGEDYYANSPDSNPQGPDSATSRVLRGGSWVSRWYDVRAANRADDYPVSSINQFGFRCAVSLGE
jgi:formylglycine-generating enzyme required for sulfatase activity